MIEERYYQTEAVDALIKFIQEKPGNPIAALPTGTGKTIVLCGFIDRFLSISPESNILVISHVREIIEQDFHTLEEYFEGYEIGLWHSGIGVKEKRKITVAGIHSIYKNSDLFQEYKIIIIDECHTINHKKSGMYRTFLSSIPSSTHIGLTATPYRLGHGKLVNGEDSLFTEVVYDITQGDSFTKLIDEGFLCKLITRKPHKELDPTGIRLIAGDFDEKQLSERFDREEITKEIIKEIVTIGGKYKLWLLFAIDIKHAENIAKELRIQGISTICVHSKMEQDRGSVIEDIKSMKYRAIVNVNILTTGFDVRQIDLIAHLRNTASQVFHVQSNGRGTRPFEGKDHCLVLDFAGNISRLGPINNIIVKERKKGKAKNGNMTKVCPNEKCRCVHHISVRKCNVCGYEFKFETKLKVSPEGANIIDFNIEGEKIWTDVLSVRYTIHTKIGKMPKFRVIYNLGTMNVSQYIPYADSGRNKLFANTWVRNRLTRNGISYNMPLSIYDLYDRQNELAIPKQILIQKTGKWINVIGVKWWEI